MDKTIGELAKEQGVFYDLKDEITKDEYLRTMDSDWAYRSDTFESEMFLSFSEGEKKVYALIYSQEYALKLLSETVEEFTLNYGDMYENINLDFI